MAIMIDPLWLEAVGFVAIWAYVLAACGVMTIVSFLAGDDGDVGMIFVGIASIIGVSMLLLAIVTGYHAHLLALLAHKP